MLLCGLTCSFKDFLLLLFRAVALYEENVQGNPERERIERTMLQEYNLTLADFIVSFLAKTI